MNEKEQKAIEIVATLKTSNQKTRDTWRAESLKRWPELAEFIEIAYQMANE